MFKRRNLVQLQSNTPIAAGISVAIIAMVKKFPGMKQRKSQGMEQITWASRLAMKW
jgi:hypothetical protein